VKTIAPGLKKLSLFCFVFTSQFFLFINMPNIPEAYFWFASLTTYILPYSLFVILLAQLIYLHIHNRVMKRQYFFIALLSFAIIGSHEIGMAVTDFTLLSFLLLNLSNSNKRIPLFFLNVFAAICTLAVFKIPGSTSRFNSIGKSRDVPSIISDTFQFEFDYLEHHFYTNIYFLLFLFIVFILSVVYYKEGNKEIKFKIPQMLLWSLVVLFLSILVVCYSGYQGGAGIRRIYNGRIGNIIFLNFSLVTSVTLFYITGISVNKGRFNYIYKHRDFLLGIFTVSLLVTGFFSKNYKNLINDITSGDVITYYENYHTRINYVGAISSPGTEIKVPPFYNRPETLFHSDINKSPKHWKNIFFCKVFCPKNTVRLFYGITYESMEDYISFVKKKNEEKKEKK